MEQEKVIIPFSKYQELVAFKEDTEKIIEQKLNKQTEKLKKQILLIKDLERTNFDKNYFREQLRIAKSDITTLKKYVDKLEQESTILEKQVTNLKKECVSLIIVVIAIVVCIFLLKPFL